MHINVASFLPITDTPLSRRIRRVRQTIWSSVLYRRAHQIVADLTRPFRRFEINLIFRQDLTGPVKLIHLNVEIDIARASADDVEQAGSPS